MQYHDDESSKNRAQLLMDITAALANYTQKADGFAHIPGYLARTLDLPPVSLSIVHTVQDGAAVLLGAFSGAVTPPSFEQDVLNIHEQSRPSAIPDGPTFSATIEIERAEAAEAGSLASFRRATVFTHIISERHRMLLIVHQRGGDPLLSAGLSEALHLVARQLGQFLECLIVWMACPADLGEPFERLTDREWNVLRFLSSDAGEKQLADQLGLSPHTLHSHIKAIYRKVGVQGRLPLLLRVEDALRVLRLSRLEARSTIMPTGMSAQKVTAA
jgi:DNA-binding CsgD family transcriptional regulator